MTRQANLFHKIVLLLLIFSQICPVTSQNRGNFSFGIPKAPSLMITPGMSGFANAGSGSGGGYSGAFVSGVGGISFDKTVVLKNGFQINSLEIQYNSSVLDGNRLELSINGNAVAYKLYDWQLLPIAKYANSKYTACFTYFGNLEDKNLETIVLDNGGNILNYHPDLANTLLGWRLADMDMLILYDFTTDLPKIDGSYVLGAGETEPDIDANNSGAYNFYNYLVSIENDLGYTFRSYVISDYSREIEVSVVNNSLNLSGDPYYYCWRLRQDAAGFNINKVGDSISSHYQTILNNELQKNPGFYERGLYIDSLISLSLKYPYSIPIYSSGTFVDLVALNTATEKENFLEQYTTNSLKEMLVDVSTYMFAYEAVLLVEFSDRMSSRPDLISAWNPAVWNATATTMRVAAFFRYVKQHYPTRWETFFQQIKNLNPEPEVITPTVIYDKGNSIIEQALANSPKVFSNEIEGVQQIVVYPNPVKNTLTIENIQGSNQLQLMDTNGKIIYMEQTGSDKIQIPMNNFSSGNYIIRILKNDNIVHRQVIVKK